MVEKHGEEEMLDDGMMEYSGVVESWDIKMPG
jgi:hypothetical protein